MMNDIGKKAYTEQRTNEEVFNCISKNALSLLSKKEIIRKELKQNNSCSEDDVQSSILAFL